MRHKFNQRLPFLTVLFFAFGFVSCDKNSAFVTTRSSQALTHYQAGLSQLYFSEYPAAIQSFEQAIRIDPLFRMGYCRLSMAYFYAGNRAKALENNYLATKEILLIKPQEHEFIQWWNAHLNRNSHAARAFLRQLQVEMPHNKEVQYHLAANLVESNLLTTAREVFKQILVSDENYLPALLGLGDYYLQSEKTDSAQMWLEKAIKLAPDKAITHLGMGKYFFAVGQYEKAHKMLKKSCTFTPKNPECFFQLALLHKELGGYQQALKYFQKYKKIETVSLKGRSRASCSEAEVFYLTANLTKAREKSIEAIELDSNNLKAYYWLGRINLTENRFDEAFAQVNQLKLLIKRNSHFDPNSKAWYHRLLSHICLDQRQFEKARKQAQEALLFVDYTEKLDYLAFAGTVSMKAGDFQGTIENCEMIFSKNPFYPPAHFLFAQVLDQQGDFALAAQQYRVLLKLYRNSDDILPVQKARTRLAILQNSKSPIKITRIAQE